MYCDPTARDLRHLLDMGECAGVRTDVMLAGTKFESLDDMFDEATLPPWQYKVALDNLYRAVPSDFGFWFGSQAIIDGYGDFTDSLNEMSNLREINYLLRRYNVIFREYNFFRGTVSRMKVGWNEWSIDLCLGLPLGQSGGILLDELISRSHRELSRHLSGNPKIKRIHLSRGRDSYVKNYEDKFECQIIFNSRKNSIVLELDTLYKKIHNYREDRRIYWENRLENLKHEMAASYLVGVAVLSELVVAPGHFPKMEVVADRLGKSVATLKRILGKEGENYQEMVDFVRVQMLRRYIGLTDMCPKQMYYELGFSNVHNLRRFVRRTTGSTISKMCGDEETVSPKQLRRTATFNPGA